MKGLTIGSSVIETGTDYPRTGHKSKTVYRGEDPLSTLSGKMVK